MFKALIAWWNRPKQPKVWLVRRHGGGWAKAVTYRRPGTGLSIIQVMGPFRSEGDAEETADTLNGNSKYKDSHVTR